MEIEEFAELKRKIDILWKLAHICPKCNTHQLRARGWSCNPPSYYCPVCKAPKADPITQIAPTPPKEATPELNINELWVTK